jgi:methionyl aminopeptidase
MHKYTEKEIEILKEGGRRLATILEVLGENCVEGMVAKKLDELAEKMILENGDIPVFKNYKPHGASYPFPATLCVSINHVVAHGIPKDEVLKAGDVVSLDLGLRHNGLVVDSAISVLVKSPGAPLKGGDSAFEKENKLLEITKKCLEIGIAECVVGKRVNDVGIAIEKFLKQEDNSEFTVVDILCGHAVGREIHSEPIIPHADFGPGGEKFKDGMVVAIEPHISMGNGQISLSKKDAWAYLADDGAKAAQFEHTILITDGKPVILTKK